MFFLKRFSSFLRSGEVRSSSIKENIVGSLAVKGFSVVVQLLLVPLTLGYVSSEIYGIWLTLSSIMVWLNFFDVGFTLGLKNKLTEAISLREWERGKALVSTTYFMMVAIFIPLTILLEFFVPKINWAYFLNISKDYNLEVTHVIYILVGFVGINMILNVLIAVVCAFQKVAMSTAFNVIGQFLSLVIIFLMTKCIPPSLVSLAWAMSIPTIVVLLFSSIYLYQTKFRLIAPSFRLIQLTDIKDLFSLGYKFFFIQIQVIVLYQTTNILISNLSGPLSVTRYNVAYKYLSVGMLLYNIILGPLWPAITDAYVKKDFMWMKSVYRRMTKVFIFMFFVMIFMILVSPVVYSIWVGKKINIPIILTVSIGIYLLINMWGGLQVSIINGIGKIKLQSYVTILGLLFHIPISLLLGKFIGGLGVIISMTLITSCYALIFSIQANKLMHENAVGIWNI